MYLLLKDQKITYPLLSNVEYWNHSIL